MAESDSRVRASLRESLPTVARGPAATDAGAALLREERLGVEPGMDHVQPKREESDTNNAQGRSESDFAWDARLVEDVPLRASDLRSRRAGSGNRP